MDEGKRLSRLEDLVSPKKLGPVDFYTIQLRLPDGRSVTMEEFLRENPDLVPIGKAMD